MTITKSGAIYRRIFLIIRLFPRLGQSIFPSSIGERSGMYSQSSVPSHPILAKCEQERIPIVSEVELACRMLHFPLIGITDSNGKYHCGSSWSHSE